MINLGEDEEAEVERTEHLMNVVVEMRKRHGAACIDYAQKASHVEQQVLKLSLDAVSKANFRQKESVPEINVENSMAELREFDEELDAYSRRVSELQRRIENTRGAVHMMQRANPVFGAASRKQLGANALLARARNKNGD